MHCDDKRTLFVLKEEIRKSWKELENSDFKEHELLQKLKEFVFLGCLNHLCNQNNSKTNSC